MRKGRFMTKLAALSLLVLAMMGSCKPSMPSDIIPKDEMESILYDYHIALAMGRNNIDGQGDMIIALREAVFKKHDITSAEFDSSMVYYMRHTEQLHAIYEGLTDRMNKEQVALGGSASDQSKFGSITSKGDTTNIWNEATTLILSTNKPFNNHSFELKADTAYHKGDRFMLDFDAQFIIQDGIRDGMAVLAVTFKNDSVASQTLRVQNSQHYSLDVSDGDTIGVKNVKGYFILGTGDFSMNSSSATTLKMMFLQNIRLVRMHRHLEPAKPALPLPPKDSLKKDSARKDTGMAVKTDIKIMTK